MDKPRGECSRRFLLQRRGLMAAGAALMGVLCRWNSGSIARKETVSLPWPYRKVDPLLAAQIAYEGHEEGGCCYAVSKSILTPLAQEVGEPYRSGPNSEPIGREDSQGANTIPAHEFIEKPVACFG